MAVLGGNVSIHTLHELEARTPQFPWKGGGDCFHSYASRIGSKRFMGFSPMRESQPFPFIRFTNWKQGDWDEEGWTLSPKGFPFIRFTNWKQVERHEFFVFLIGKYVSIHTLHELEARIMSLGDVQVIISFHSYASRIGSKLKLWTCS